jgi:hypothetical protein
VKRGAAVALVIAAMLAVAADRPPTAAFSSDGALTITLPADLLRSREVKEQLTSGLTTVFVITVTARHGRETTKGGARIDVRYALWEEQYVVAVLDPTGQERRATFDSEAAFARWWTENALVVTAPRSFGRRVDAQVKLKMLPFSSQEQNDTRRWLSRSISASQDRTDDTRAAQSAEILRIIVETSVRRRPLLEREWSARAERP